MSNEQPMTKDFMDELLGSIKMDFEMNGSDGELPYAYTNPASEGKVKWVCNYDEQGKIVGVFAFQDGKEIERRIHFLDDKDHAKKVLEELIADGWVAIEPPKVSISAPDGKKISARQMKRHLEKKAKQFEKAEKKKEQK